MVCQQSGVVEHIFIKAMNFDLTIVIISDAITEFVYVLDRVYNLKKIEIAEMIQEFLQMSGIEFISGRDPQHIFKFWPALFPGFGDAVLAAVAVQKKMAVFTFDQRLSLL